MTLYVAAETWSLCDFRSITGPRKSIKAAIAAEALEGPEDGFQDMMGRDCDPGTELNVGDWMSAQNGMVCEHTSKEEALRWLRGKVPDVLVHGSRGRWRAQRNTEIGVGPIYVGRVARIHKRYRDGNAVVVILRVHETVKEGSK